MGKGLMLHLLLELPFKKMQIGYNTEHQTKILGHSLKNDTLTTERAMEY